jgi:hypothetical protein
MQLTGKTWLLFWHLALTEGTINSLSTAANFVAEKICPTGLQRRSSEV